MTKLLCNSTSHRKDKQIERGFAHYCTSQSWRNFCIFLFFRLTLFAVFPRPSKQQFWLKSLIKSCHEVSSGHSGKCPSTSFVDTQKQTDFAGTKFHPGCIAPELTKTIMKFLDEKTNVIDLVCQKQLSFYPTINKAITTYLNHNHKMPFVSFKNRLNMEKSSLVTSSVFVNEPKDWNLL